MTVVLRQARMKVNKAWHPPYTKEDNTPRHTVLNPVYVIWLYPHYLTIKQQVDLLRSDLPTTKINLHFSSHYMRQLRLSYRPAVLN